MFLDKNKRMYENIYVISNEYKWDKNGKAVEIKKPIIHCMNKDETMIKDFPEIYKRVENRERCFCWEYFKERY